MNKKHRHEKPLALKNENGKLINNPNMITVNQHVIPKRHISEWSNDESMVNVNEISSNITKRFLASNPYFCAMRLWNQSTETRLLGPNEKNYQDQIDLLKKGLDFTKPEFIFAYYIMLCTRT